LYKQKKKTRKKKNWRNGVTLKGNQPTPFLHAILAKNNIAAMTAGCVLAYVINTIYLTSQIFLGRYILENRKFIINIP